eukprot:TRINITY_DN672_c0_g1_i1.p1 TRINITY_DN672_c0_g1~~TRINITY_DN672_c0_g1_i1.p1  ORF type:complete len:293 (-),score=75.04 TRINITY_DN672_c0_g1_i1:103-981(-)
MGKFCQLILGPAGSGKSTYCSTINEYCENEGRRISCVNLDPAAENFDYPITIDIRELITVDEFMDEFECGPNGGLILCIQYLLDHFDWFEEQIGDFEEDYLLIDCPGQIELYTHFDHFKKITQKLENIGYRICAVSLLDSHFMMEPSLFISASLMCLSMMVNLGLPHINVISKMDLYEKDNPEIVNRGDDDECEFNHEVDKFLECELDTLENDLKSDDKEDKFYNLTKTISGIVKDFSLVKYVGLNKDRTESVRYLLSQVDFVMQYGEDLEPKEPKYAEEGEDNYEDFFEDN